MTRPNTFTWFVSVGALAALAFVLSFTGAARPLQSVAQQASEPVVATLTEATAPLADLIANAGSYGRVRDENRELRAENERLRAELATAQEENVRAAAVNDLLGVGSALARDQVVVGSVIARDPNTGREVIAISRGARDGVRDGMSVLGAGGALIGTVERALESVSWVRLITDPRSEVNVVVQESRAMALATGAAQRGLKLEFLPQRAEVKAGDTIVTSGLGGAYPPGLLVGRVAKVDGGALEVFRDVQIEPAGQLTALETVAVMTSFQPTPVDGLRR